MGHALEVLGVLLVLPVAIVGAAWMSVQRKMHRAIRITPSSPTFAPFTWLWSPRRGAVLHRRLQFLCQVVLESQPEPKRRLRKSQKSPRGLSEIAQQVLAEAELLDRKLVIADRFRLGARSSALDVIESEVRTLESAAHRMDRLATMQALLSSKGSQLTYPLSLEDRLQTMEAAVEELGTSQSGL